MGGTWCRSSRIVPEADTPCNSQLVNENSDSSANSVNASDDHGADHGGHLAAHTTIDACVETDFVYVYCKEEYENAMRSQSERLQELEDRMNTHEEELNLAINGAVESTKMECQKEMESYKEQVREENRKIAAERTKDLETRHIMIVAELRAEIKLLSEKCETLNKNLQEAKKQLKFKQIVEKLSVDYPTYTRDEFKAVLKQLRKQHNRLSNKPVDFIIQQMREVIVMPVVTSNQMSTQSTSQQQQQQTSTTVASYESPTFNNNIVEEVVPASMETDNGVRIKIKNLLKLWDNNGFLSEIENHTSTVTGLYTVKELTTALTAYKETPHDYLHKLQGEESYKIKLAKSYAIFAWIAKYISYDHKRKEGILAGPLTAPARLSLDDILKKRSAVCQEYAELFHAFSQEAGMETEVIPGHSKSFAKETLNSGHYQSFTPKLSNSHCWNAVSVCFIYTCVCTIIIL